VLVCCSRRYFFHVVLVPQRNRDQGGPSISCQSGADRVECDRGVERTRHPPPPNTKGPPPIGRDCAIATLLLRLLLLSSWSRAVCRLEVTTDRSTAAAAAAAAAIVRHLPTPPRQALRCDLLMRVTRVFIILPRTVPIGIRWRATGESRVSQPGPRESEGRRPSPVKVENGG
jgi:hypothetical protein